jgi:hypothetical protein
MAKDRKVEQEVIDLDAETLPAEQRAEALAKQRDYDRVIGREYERLIEKYEKFSRFVEIVRIEAIKATEPQDWINQAPAESGDPMDDIVALWSPGAEKAATKAPWIKIRYHIPRRIDYAAGSEIPYAYMQSGDVVLNVPGMDAVVYEGLTAGRGCDRFFTAGAKGRGEAMPNEIDVLKAAQSAFVRVAITKALGLRNMRRRQLAAIMGETFAKAIKTVERRMGAKGRDLIPAGMDTADTLAKLTEAQRKLHDRVLELLGDDRRPKWAGFMEEVSKSDKYPGRKSFHAFTDNSAAWIMNNKLARMTQAQAEALADGLK